MEWITCAEQGRKRCQPPFLYPDSTNGIAVSRHKCCLPQPLQVYARCLAFNKKLQNTQEKWNHYQETKKWPKCWKYWTGNFNCRLTINFDLKTLLDLQKSCKDRTKNVNTCFPWLFIRIYREHVYTCWKERKKGKSLTRVRLFVTPWTVAHQAPPSMGFSKWEYWSGLPFPSPGDLPHPGIKPRSPAS